MYSIGQISDRSGVKIPTIRYYENVGLIKNAGRTAGNQRRYDDAALDKLIFIKHCRDMGFAPSMIRDLLTLNGPCDMAHVIAKKHLGAVQAQIASLQSLSQELARIAALQDTGSALDCQVLRALSSHATCTSSHNT